MSTIHDPDPTAVAFRPVRSEPKAWEDDGKDDVAGAETPVGYEDYREPSGGALNARGLNRKMVATAAAFVGGVIATAAVGAIVFGSTSHPQPVAPTPVNLLPSNQNVAPVAPPKEAQPAPPPRTATAPRIVTPAPAAPPAVRPAPVAPAPAVRPAPAVPAAPAQAAPPPAPAAAPPQATPADPPAAPPAPPKVTIGPEGIAVDGPNGNFSIGEGGIQAGGPGGQFKMGDDGIHIGGPNADITIPLIPLP